MMESDAAAMKTWARVEERTAGCAPTYVDESKVKDLFFDHDADNKRLYCTQAHPWAVIRTRPSGTTGPLWRTEWVKLNKLTRTRVTRAEVVAQAREWQEAHGRHNYVYSIAQRAGAGGLIPSTWFRMGGATLEANRTLDKEMILARVPGFVSTDAQAMKDVMNQRVIGAGQGDAIAQAQAVNRGAGWSRDQLGAAPHDAGCPCQQCSLKAIAAQSQKIANKQREEADVACKRCDDIAEVKAKMQMEIDLANQRASKLGDQAGTLLGRIKAMEEENRVTVAIMTETMAKMQTERNALFAQVKSLKRKLA